MILKNQFDQLFIQEKINLNAFYFKIYFLYLNKVHFHFKLIIIIIIN